tara:strand:- start:367 stop:813 length:447 start_codon:yes stop_codon:yes gene_type:complete
MLRNFVFLRNLFWVLLITILLGFEFCFNITKTCAYASIISVNNISDCKSKTNCVLEIWEVKNPEKAFDDLVDILENTPRLKIVNKENEYIRAIVTSRIMKFIDDIEIKSFPNKKILMVKSKSRKGFIDFGVNKRRLENLHFRLIDIYN